VTFLKVVLILPLSSLWSLGTEAEARSESPISEEVGGGKALVEALTEILGDGGWETPEELSLRGIGPVPM